MISLILILFISLLSFGSPVYRLDVSRESSVSTFSNTYSESLNSKYAWQYSYSYVLSSTEFASTLDNWILFANRRFGEDNLFSTGVDYFSTGSTINESYIDTDYCQDLRWCDISSFIQGNNTSSYPYKAITRIRLSYTRLANNIYATRGVHFTIDGLGERYITFYCYDNYVDGSGLPQMVGSLYNSVYYYTANNFIYDEGFTYNNPSVFYDIWYNPNSHDYDVGYYDGEQVGYRDGVRDGRQIGYTEGLNEANNYDSVASSIFTGIFDVGLLPVNVFLTIFNFELFGVNIAGILSGLLTLSVVIIVLRFLLGGKKDD